MSQYEQENDLGAGGGEVDDDTMREAWERAEELHGPVDPESGTTPQPDDDETEADAGS